MRRLVFIVSISLLIFVIGWEFWPIEQQISTLKYLEIEGQDALLHECSNYETFIDGQWVIEHPRKIELEDTGKISMTFQSLIPTQEESIEGDCKIIIESFLELPRVVIRPGFRIYSPYTKAGELKFTWDIRPMKQDIVGILWVYSIIEEGMGNENRVPMFAIPIEIKTISFLSLQPKLVRIISFIVSLLLLLLLFIFSPLEDRML